MSNQQLPTNTFDCAKWIVSATASNGTHTTIGAALTSASSGDTIFIRPGTYTENLSISSNVNLTAFDCDAQSNGVTIIGKISVSGNVTISGIRLQTNSDNLLSMTGSSNVTLENCYLSVANNPAISQASSGTLTINNCLGDMGSGAFTYWNMTGGSLRVNNSALLNSNGNTTASTSSNGSSLYLQNSQINFPVTTSNTALLNMFNCPMLTTNTTALTINGTGQVLISNCYISSGTASTISVGTGATLNLSSCSIQSSNTNAITGLGTLNYGGIVFTGTSSTINTSTQNPIPFSLAQGGTNAALTASNGGIFYSTASAGAILAGTATAGQILRSGSSTTPSWSTATYPATAGTSGNVLTSDGTNWNSTAPAASPTTGTWTPALAFGGGTTGITYTTQVGSYAKIGQLVIVTAHILLSSKGSSTGSATLTGLPFNTQNTANLTQSLLIILKANVTVANAATSYLQVASNSTSGNVDIQATTGGTSQLSDTNFAATSELLIQGAYIST